MEVSGQLHITDVQLSLGKKARMLNLHPKSLRPPSRPQWHTKKKTKASKSSSKELQATYPHVQTHPNQSLLKELRFTRQPSLQRMCGADMSAPHSSTHLRFQGGSLTGCPEIGRPLRSRVWQHGLGGRSESPAAGLLEWWWSSRQEVGTGWLPQSARNWYTYLCWNTSQTKGRLSACQTGRRREAEEQYWSAPGYR